MICHSSFTHITMEFYIILTIASCNSSEIVNIILKIRSFISQKLPDADIILSKLIMRLDTAAGKVTIKEVNKQLNNFDFDKADNSNLSRAHLKGMFCT